MKKFEFPLQAVLTLRALKQEQALEIYAKSVQDCATKRSDMILATRRADNLELLLDQKTGTLFSASMRVAYLKALDASREEVVRREKMLEEAEKLKEQRLNEFLDRKRKREVLENLNEKQLNEHLAEGYRKEEIEIEDMVISRSGAARIAG
jgi:flagellar export protein FliJ